MNTPLSWMSRGGLLFAAASFALALAGCASDEPARRAESPRHPRAHVPPLVGHETFFNGQITAELNVGSGPGFPGKPGQEGDEAGPEPKRHGSGGGFRMGGMGGGGGSRHHGGGEGGEMGGGPEGSAADQVERQQMSAMRHAANLNPPVMIHLRFTNHGTTRAELLVADFLSPLGNFVVEPEKLELEPGQTIEVEPMTSRLVGEISGAAVTLALRLAGQGEKKTINLTIVPEAPPSAAPQGTTPEQR